MNNKERDSEYQDTEYQDTEHQDTGYSSTSEELRDVLIAISVVAKRLAKKYEDKSKEE